MNHGLAGGGTRSAESSPARAPAELYFTHARGLNPVLCPRMAARASDGPVQTSKGIKATGALGGSARLWCPWQPSCTFRTRCGSPRDDQTS